MYTRVITGFRENILETLISSYELTSTVSSHHGDSMQKKAFDVEREINSFAPVYDRLAGRDRVVLRSTKYRIRSEFTYNLNIFETLIYYLP